MVKLTKIYTRTGDQGETGLVGGARVAKADLRIEVIGVVDEANAAIGLGCAELTEAGDAAIRAELLAIQHDLFDLGADLATPPTGGDEPALRITAAHVTRLEQAIDRLNAGLAPLGSFILPGGARAAAALHLARTIVRRAERAAWRLASEPAAGVNHAALTYLNRLSDYLFVAARQANGAGAADVLWQPGQSITS